MANTDHEAAFGEAIRRDHFSFAPEYRPLNHGSFGAFPRNVAEHRRQLQLETEARPDTFLRDTYPKLLLEARAAVAPLIGAHTDEVVFVPNATTGVNTVLRNLGFREGDVVLHFNTIYGACLKTIQSLGETTAATPHAIDITYPVEDDEIVRLFEEAVRSIRAQGKTVRLAVFDTVLTFPGVRFPWEPLVRLCKDLGILSFVDGAHGIGHIDLTHLGQLKPDFMISNCYKWLMVPRGCAVLYVPFANQHIIRTTFPTSWGYETPEVRPTMTTTEYFVRLFVKVSTSDTTPYICIPQALAFRRDICGGEEKVRGYCEKMAREGGRRVAEILGTEVLENKSQTLGRCCFANVRLPLSPSRLGLAGPEGVRVARWIKEKTPEYETYLPTSSYAGAFWSRLSGQVYLTMDDFEWAAKTLLEICRRVEAGEWKQV
ncbi:hypothetical protein VMCG_00937 [Cytospora schulzeri]|uniref:Aminotransferase class V domain-containing protein n=1 Tax=Cytospora schulzeri TaxID=448051 RepID=A0A423X4X5_9PEZI|nr:hypothetical protein VMCG_00937 [Valsa malicola]